MYTVDILHEIMEDNEWHGRSDPARAMDLINAMLLGVFDPQKPALCISEYSIYGTSPIVLDLETWSII